MRVSYCSFTITFLELSNTIFLLTKTYMSISRFNAIEEERLPLGEGKLILTCEHYNFDRDKRRKSARGLSQEQKRTANAEKEKLRHGEAVLITS